jgi:hypothetical protein
MLYSVDIFNFLMGCPKAFKALYDVSLRPRTSPVSKERVVGLIQKIIVPTMACYLRLSYTLHTESLSLKT